MNGQQRIGMFGALAGLALLVGGLIAPVKASATNVDNHNDDHKVTICHGTSGLGETKNGYNIISVDKNSIITQGHNTHLHHGLHDIIPAFTYTDKHGTHQFAGLGDASWIATKCAPPVTTTTVKATTTTAAATTTTAAATTTTAAQETSTTAQVTTTTAAQETSTTAQATTTTAAAPTTTAEATTTSLASEAPIPTTTALESAGPVPTTTTGVLGESGALPTTGGGTDGRLPMLGGMMLSMGLVLMALARRTTTA